MKFNFGSSKYSKAALIVLFIALCIRVYLIPLPGHFEDMSHFVRWTKAATTDGIAYVYAIAFSDYPPGIFYIYKPIGILYQEFISPNFDDTMLLRMLLKIPAVIADMTTAILLFSFVQKWKSEKTAFWAMTFYALNPAIIYVSAYWGQVDAINTLLMLLSIMFLIRNKVELSWAMFTLSILIKMHAIVISPILLFVSIKKYSWKRLLKAGVLSLLIILLVLSPFLFNSQINHVKNVYARAVGSYPFISVNAFNFWWLLQPIEIQKMQSLYLEGKQDNQPILGGITYRHLGLFLFALFTCCILLMLRQNGDTFTIGFAAFAMTFAYFMLPTQMHERYLFPAFAFLSLVSHKRRFWGIMYGILSITFFLNLQILPFYDSRFQLLTTILGIPIKIPFMTTAMSIVNTVLFGFLLFFIVTNLPNKNYEFKILSKSKLS